MITVIRDRLIKNKAYKIIIIILAVVLALSLAIPGIKIGMGQEWAARVNGDEISYSDFMRKTQEFDYQLMLLKQQAGPSADMMLQAMGLANIDPKSLALDILTQEVLLDQAALRIPLHLNDDYISERLGDAHFVRQALSEVVPPYVIDPAHGINMQLLKTYLRQAKMSLSDFENSVKKVLTRQLLQEIVALAYYTPTFELLGKYNVDFLGKSFSVITFSLESFIQKEKQKKIPSEELKIFFDRYISEGRYRVPEKRTGITWTFNPSSYGITLTDENIEMYYNDHKISDFLEKPAQVEVRTIVFTVNDERDAQEVYKKAKTVHLDLLKNPALFAEKAKELSQDKESAQKGGLLPAFAKGGTQDERRERAAFLLQKDGDIVPDVVRTNQGFEILQRVSKKAPVYKTLDSVRSTIKSLLLQEKFKENFVQDMQYIIDKPERSDKELKEFIAEHGGSIKPYNALEKKDATKLTQVAFDLKEQGLGYYLEENSGSLVLLTKIEKSYQPSIEILKETLENDIYEERAALSLKETMKKAQSLAHTEQLSAITSKLGGSIKHIDVIKKSDSERIKTLRSEGYPVEKMFQLEKVGQIHSFEHDGNGYLVKVDTVEPLDVQKFQEEKAKLRNTLTQERIQVILGAFVASLYRNATITLNESLFKNS